MISIITPTLNAGQTLPALIKSIKMFCNECEHIVVDGGSSDNTIDVASSSGAIVIDAVGCTIYEGQNIGISASSGDWLYFIGSDDTLFANDSLSKSVSECEKIGSRFASGLVFFPNNRRLMPNRPTRSTRQQSYIYHKSLYTEFGMYDTSKKVYADVLFQNLLALNSVQALKTELVFANVMLGGFSSRHTEEYPK